MLSVVIPVRNREREIVRALESCLAQREADFEIVVVDDASTDGTADVVAAYANRGVRLLRHAVNRGSTPARATGIRAARGDWIVRLDSDDELVPTALQRIQACASDVSERVGRVGFMYRYEDGRRSPFPPPDGRPLCYDAFLAWLERSQLYDCLTVTRRRALDEVPMPDGRLMEFLHHLDFARRFDTLWVPEVGATYHVDARGRQSRSVPAPEEARQAVEEIRLIVERHGEAIRRLAPRFYRAQLRRRTVMLALAGDRGASVLDGLRQLAARPWLPLQWAAALSVVCGPRVLEHALNVKWRLVEERRRRFLGRS